MRVEIFNKKVSRQRYFWHDGMYKKYKLLIREGPFYRCSLIELEPRSWERGGLGRNDQENWDESKE